MVEIVRYSLTTCKLTSDNEKEIAFAKKNMNIAVEGAEYSEMFQDGSWDGIKKFINARDNIGLGLLDELYYHFDRKKIPYRLYDAYMKKADKLSFEIDERMRPYQKKAIETFFQRNIGTIKVPPRGGKTFIASEMARIFLDNFKTGTFLFVVDTEDLFMQAIDDISGYLGVDKAEIGQVQGRKKIFKRVTVAMAQSLVSMMSYMNKKTTDVKVKKKKAEFRLFIRSVLFVGVDEIHENSSKKRIAAYKKFTNKKFLASFSGTPLKQFGLIENLSMMEYFGGIIYEITKADLQEKGFLAMDKVFLMHVNHSKHRFNCEGYQEHLKAYIHTNDYRNSLLQQVINVCIKNKWKTLAIFSSVKHGKIISSEMSLPFISGEDGGDVRDKAKRAFLRGKGGVLIASNIFKKGVTLPEAEIIIIGDGGLEGSNVTQKYSRVLGVTDEKKRAIIVDLMDSGVDYFSEHSLNRLSVYDEEMGEERIEVYEDYQILLMEESMAEWINMK